MPYQLITSEVVAHTKSLLLTLREPDPTSGAPSDIGADSERLLSDLCDAVDDALGRGAIRLGHGEPMPDVVTVVLDLGRRRPDETALVPVLHRFRWYVISRKKAFDLRSCADSHT
jgi:hypothetical protein